MDIINLDTKVMVCSNDCPFMYNSLEAVKVCPFCEHAQTNSFKLTKGILRSPNDPLPIYIEAVRESFNSAL